MMGYWKRKINLEAIKGADPVPTRCQWLQSQYGVVSGLVLDMVLMH